MQKFFFFDLSRMPSLCVSVFGLQGVGFVFNFIIVSREDNILLLCLK